LRHVTLTSCSTLTRLLTYTVGGYCTSISYRHKLYFVFLYIARLAMLLVGAIARGHLSVWPSVTRVNHA